jgi:hypothetical protein
MVVHRWKNKYRFWIFPSFGLGVPFNEYPATHLSAAGLKSRSGAAQN